MHDDDLPAKTVTFEAVIDSGVLASLDDERFCDLFELLCAEVLFRFVMAPPGRCGLCLHEATAARLCPRHRSLLATALEVFRSSEAPEDDGPGA